MPSNRDGARWGPAGTSRLGLWLLGLAMALMGAPSLALADDAPPDAAAETDTVPTAAPPVEPAVEAEDVETPEAAPIPDHAAAIEADLVDVLARVSRSTVTVMAHKDLERAGDSVAILSGAGSGVLITWRGTWILTNAHVVSDPGSYRITLDDGRALRVAVHARDRSNDLALLRLKDHATDLHPVDVPTRDPDVQDGAWVVATGNPFLLAADGRMAASLGVLSGSRGGPRSRSSFMLQHDAEINPGSSGGPLWSLDGELLGLNGAIVTRSLRQGGGPCHTGASITIPLSRVRRFLDQVVLHGDTPRTTTPPPTVAPSAAEGGSKVVSVGGMGRLGLVGITSLSRRGHRNGVLIQQVEATSPLARRLQAGDRLIHIVVDGLRRPTTSIGALDRILSTLPSGRFVTVRWLRHGTQRTWRGRLP